MCLCAGFATSLAISAEYYVAPNGDDGNSGTSASSAWRTIGKANATLKPGDVVYLRGGKYVNDPIRPSRSGAAGSEIRYVAYPGEQPVLTSKSSSGLTVAIDLTDRSYIVVDGIDVDGVKPGPDAYVDHFVNLYNASYNTISNGTFRYANGWHGIRITYEAHHNKLLDNVIDHVGVWDDGTGHDYGDAIQILRGSHHNLLRGNVLKRGAHNLLQVDAPNNIIVENVFENDWSETEGTGKGGRNLTLMGKRNLFERNVVKNALASADEPANAGMKTEGQWNIVRRNFIFRNINEGITTETHSDSKASQNNRIYHNTIYGNGGPAWGLVFYTGDGITGNVFKNNIVYRNRTRSDLGAADFFFRLASNPMGIVGQSLVEGNLISADAKVDIRDGGGVMTLEKAMQQYPDTFRNNILATPTFVRPDPQEPEDFALAPGSRGIDEALPLTRTTGAGSGTVVAVADASYFSDGFGLIEGDRIQIGGGKPLKVTKVDYAANTLTLSESTEWSKDAPVTLEYAGNGPDIGAYEAVHGPQARKPMPPNSLTGRPL
ncbi:MAG TPA: NosD domain-containing protein [Gammaproteobacteria bacterium]